MDIQQFQPSTTGPEYLRIAFAEPWEIDPGDNLALQGLKSAHAGAAAAWKSIHDQHQRFSKDGTRTALANLQRSAAHARKRQAEVERNIRGAIEAGDKNIQAIDVELDKYVNLPGTPADAQVAAEIRAHVKSFRTHDDREQFIQHALDSRDLATVRAVLSAPHYLSGTIAMTQARWRQDFFAAMAPGMAATRQNLSTGMKLAHGALQALDRHTRDLIDFRKADDLDALAKELEGTP